MKVLKGLTLEGFLTLKNNNDVHIEGISDDLGVNDDHNLIVNNALKVDQNISSSNTAYPLLFGTTTGNSGYADVYKDISITVNPSTNTITATTFSGALSGNAATATTASKLSTTIAGNISTPIYFANGIPVACNLSTTYALKSHDHVLNQLTDLHSTWDATLKASKPDYLTSLPTASTTVKGGIKIGSGLSMNGEALYWYVADWGAC